MKELVERQRAYFFEGHTRPLKARLRALKKLKKGLQTMEEVFLKALKMDLNKSKIEAYLTELAQVYTEIDDLIKNLGRYMRARRVGTSLTTFPAKGEIVPEPYGVVLILSPWNYPVNLSLIPLAGAIAAGNTVVLKPSRSAAYTSVALETMILELFPPEFVSVLPADSDYEKVTGQAWDYIFFTGSPRAGKEVMATAAKKLVPVTLELGGKSPAIIDETANLDLAARRIVWGKFLNAGQTCIAVDHIFVAASVKDQLVEKLAKEVVRQIHPRIRRGEYPAIINDKHFERLSHALKEQPQVIGGQRDARTRIIAPAILPKAELSHEVMAEEIFGPLLPVLPYEDFDELLRSQQKRPKPLALYFFSQDKARQDKLLNHLSFGGGCINDCILHLSDPKLPFGGVGNSGMGQYHGKASFDTFSHDRSLLVQMGNLDLPLRYVLGKNKFFGAIKKFI